MAKSGVMPEGHLHAVVDAIAAAGSQHLARRAAEGASVPFDLVEVPSSGGGAPLFSYRPRTRDFVEEHATSLRQLPAWSAAVTVLASYDGLGDYLLSRGERHVPIDPRDRADLVLRVLLATMHAETGDFLHTPARSAEAADGIARCLLAGRIEGTVVVPLLGVRLEAERLEIENGLVLVRDDTIADLPREARSPARTRPGTVVMVTSLEDPAQAAALAQARPRLRALLTALRLYDTPSPALAPVAWSRVRGDGWASHPFIGTCARATGTLELATHHHDAVRGFCALIATRGPDQGSSAWALRRFELACERADFGEALTDSLLGLRALLEADGVGSGALADRLAALCAAPGDWDAMRDRVELAESLERALMLGTVADPTRTRALSLELRTHLRALLRDIACGHLPADLVSLAEHHLASEEPVEAAEEPAAVVTLDDQDDVVITDARGRTSPLDALDAEVSAGAPFGPSTTAPDRSTSPGDLFGMDSDGGRPSPRAVGVSPLRSDHGSIVGPTPPTTALAGVDAQVAVIEPADSLAVEAPELGAYRTSAEPLVEQAGAPASQPDPRTVTETGERFEDAFIRSFTEGPGSAHRRRRRP